MNPISRRASLNLLLGATVSVAAAGCAQWPGSRPDDAAPPPPPRPPAPTAARPAPPPPQIAGAALRSAFTDRDRALYQDCLDKTMRGRVGRVWRWRNRQSGNGGSITPTSPRQVAGGQTCRSFRETIVLKDGRRESLTGQACQRADGSWNIVA